ncbi:MAG: 50S ribosomal protein L29 [Candidatus Omnitrophica bacterium]|nr:50S ribosomal protein L29 [Candidatus Omnitrophota bacterium]
MKYKDLKEFSDEELFSKENELKKETFQLNSQRQLGRVEKPSSFRNNRKDIARILTVLSERKANGKKR